MSRSAFSSNQLNVVGPGITTSAISGGPPANPTDGDIWIASAVDTNGTRWQFQYNAGSSSTYKWEFIGGPPIWTHYDYSGGLSLGNSTYTAITNLAITVPRAGDYIFTADAQISTGQAAATEVILALSQNSTAGPAAGGVGTGGEGASYFAFPFTSGAGSGSNAIHPSGMYHFQAASANDVFRVLGWAAATGTNTVSMARFHCIPVRIS